MDYQVKDIKLAEQGKKNIEWAEAQMGALLKVQERFKKEHPLHGTKVGMALHVTKETGVLVKTLQAGGAEVAIASCNPLSTQDDVAAALAEEGVAVFAKKGETKEEYYEYINEVINFLKIPPLRPVLSEVEGIRGGEGELEKNIITIDDGCDLVSEIHKNHSELIPQIICGCEETTTGIIRLKAMEKDGALKYPIIAVNDNKTKHLFDNYYGTGQSTWDGILRSSSILVAGKTVVVAGYGSCGKGVAMRAKGLGANVVVTEVDNFRALQAHTDGFRVMPMNEAARIGDIFVTVTGDCEVIGVEQMKLMKAGAIMANAGHFDNEIDVVCLDKAAAGKRRLRPYFDEYILAGKKIYLAGEGRLVNLACAEGHPSEVMSLSFCGQALASEWGVKNKDKIKPEVITLPEEIDDQIAKLQLDYFGVRLDQLTDKQKKYLSSWQEGT